MALQYVRTSELIAPTDAIKCKAIIKAFIIMVTLARGFSIFLKMYACFK